MSKDYENLSDQEIDDLLNNEEQAESEPEEEPEEQPEETEGDEDTGEQLSLDDLEGEQDSEEPEPETDKPEEQPVKTDSRFKSQADAERAYFELQKLSSRHSNELGELRKELASLREKPADKPQQPETPTITPEQLADLWVDDPQTAMEYVTQKAVERMQQQTQAQQEAARRQEAVQKTNDALVEFVEAHQDKMSEAEFTEFGDFVRDNVKTPKSGYYTKADLDRAFSWWKAADLQKESVENAKREVLKKMSDASPKVRTLSSASNAKAKGKPDIAKARDRYDVEDIARTMSNDELEEALSKI